MKIGPQTHVPPSPSAKNENDNSYLQALLPKFTVLKAVYNFIKHSRAPYRVQFCQQHCEWYIVILTFIWQMMKLNLREVK